MKTKPKKKTARPAKQRSRSSRTPKASKPKRRAIVAAKRKPPSKPKRKPVAKLKPVAKAKPKRAVKPRAIAKAKPVAKPKRAAAARPASPKRSTPPASRRDATGHLTPKYAADLHARSMESAEPEDAPSFVKGSKSSDPLAEELGEGFVQTALSGEDTGEDAEFVPEESGGPFVESSGQAEFAQGTDASNPRDAKREPFPTT